jgi:hypothetical protein
MAKIDLPSAPKSGNRTKIEDELSTIEGELLKATEDKIFAMNAKCARNYLCLMPCDLGQLTDTYAPHVTIVECAQHNTSIDSMASLAQTLGHPLNTLMNPRFGDESRLDLPNNEYQIP